MDIDLTTLTDDQLDQLRIDVLAEKERRINRERIPQNIAEQSRTYLDAGGDPKVLEEAVRGDVA